VYRSLKPLEELALDLLFESYGEDRYNRSAEEYEYLATLTENIKDVHFRVNKRLAEYKKSGQPRWGGICYFQPGDAMPRYKPFPDSISIETIRSALNFSGFRKPKWRKQRALSI
jgi:hypothetical protein